MPNRPKRGSGERSNWYSGSKFTNWTPFDPYWSEAKSNLSRGRPSLRVDIPEREKPLPIVSLDTHSEFLRPCSPEDVESTLLRIPGDYLVGIDRVVLLGGTKKQARALRLFKFGCYTPATIFLHAFPRSMMTMYYGSELKPSRAREYERAGAAVESQGGETQVSFDSSSLRRFYLYDVLLHEIGHHVDERAFDRPNAAAEGYAEWFAEAQSRLIDDSR